ncbi:single-stranded DNA-binding protein [bacterium]|nr:single-stranded DNA-binding protein [bacterium]
MTVCKATFSGTVFRAPEKRFTQNNVPITFLTLKIDGNDGLLVRVISMGKTAETVEKVVSKNDKIVVEGRLKTGAVKDEDGNERRVIELDLSSFEKIGGSIAEEAPGEIAKFSEEDFSDDLIGEDEIPF